VIAEEDYADSLNLPFVITEINGLAVNGVDQPKLRRRSADGELGGQFGIAALCC